MDDSSSLKTPSAKQQGRLPGNSFGRTPDRARAGAPRPAARPGFLRGCWDWIAGYLMGDDPTFWIAMVPMLVLSALLFTRHLASNYIFDEQEALLANPYVNGKSLAFKDAVKRDFWGLPPDRSVGSYRPIPNYVWRGVWEGQQAVTKAVNAALVKSEPVIRRLAPSKIPPRPLSLLNLLSIAVALPTLVGLSLALARRRRSGRVSAAVLLLPFTAMLAVGAPGWVHHWVGIGGVVGLLLLTLPVWGLAAALVPGVLLCLVGQLPTNAVPPVMQPWLFHWVNVLFHAANGALLVVFVFGLTRRRGLAWLAGTVFVCSAVLTEAVSGVVGIADVMGGLGAMLALLALRLPLWVMPAAVLAGVTFGLFSKESALVCVPLVPFAAVVLAPATHPKRPWRWLRGLFALVGSVAALVLYVQLRKMWFPAPVSPDLSASGEHANLLARAVYAFREWFHQAPLPRDPLNNPLVDADFTLRLAGALRVFWRGLVQVVLPLQLSGDYSFPQEPVPARFNEPENLLGALAMIGLPILAFVLWARAWQREKRVRGALRAAPSAARSAINDLNVLRASMPHLAMLAAVGLVWVVVAYFPHSNIPVLLPTVRAERFWYFPVIGSSLAIAAVMAWWFEQARRAWAAAVTVGLCSAFLTFQAARARTHAFDYTDDLTFWDATRKAVPNSAKAQLNYSVMWGARGRLDVRLHANRRALELAPTWPMAHIYLGDTLCRLHRTDEAWPHYKKGFELAPGDPNLVALALQCLWDENALEEHRDALLALADANSGSWLAYLARDTLDNGEKNDGVDPQYRPRGYNEGPKD